MQACNIINSNYINFIKFIQTKLNMTSAYLPSILVPLVGIIFPGLTMALLFLYIEEENIA